MLDHMMIQKKKVARAYNKQVRRKSFEEWELVWKVSSPSVLNTKNWENGLLTGRDYSRFTKYCLEMPIGYQAFKGSHIKGSSMGSTSRNTFPQCGKSWTLLRKTKVGNEGITSKISPIDHFWIGETIHSNYFE